METLHPAVVHFAIVLPLVALTFQALFLLKKSEAYSKSALVTMVFGTLFVIAAYLTGSDDASNGVGEILSTYDSKGMAELKEHAQLGLYLLIAINIIAVLKIVNFFKLRNSLVDMIILISLLGTSVMMLAQGKEGGEIVYEHGTIFEAHEMKDILKGSLTDLADSDDKEESLEILTDAIKSALKMEE